MEEDRTSDTPTVAAPLPAGGSRFAGRYAVRRLLGRGAAKEVYLAYDERLDREVALAVVVGAAAGARAARARREAQFTGRLGDHPHIVTVYDAGEHDGVPYLVLRHMAGGSVAEAPRVDALRVAREVALALAHVHAHGVVHRDVKPDNIWLAADGSAALGDFGIAFGAGGERLTAEGAVVGTLRYLSPEQARGEAVGPASDVYSLGVTLYELLAGRPPFAGTDPGALLAQHLAAEPPPLGSAPEAVAALVADMLAKRPEDRPDAAAVAEALGGAESPAATDGFVGRETVMAALGEAWERALAGSPASVALAGEPGIGKTRCVEELARRAAAAGATVAWGRCAEHEGVPPFWPWTRALRELTGDGLTAEAANGAGAAEARFRLFDDVAQRLAQASGERPVVLALEDLHWADRSSLELLVHVARELHRGRLLLVLTYRDGAPAVRQAVGELARARGFARLELRGLSVTEVARYVAALTGAPPAGEVAARLHARTEGNPFYVAELARDAAAVPGTLRDAIAARLERLPTAPRALVEAAAVAGRDASLGTVARAAELSRADALDALEAAAAAHLLDDDAAPRCRFAHAIVREVVYESLGRPRRARLHTALAELVAERGGLAAELAHHRLAAARAGAEPEPALAACEDAAREAATRLAFAEAAEHYEGAVEAAALADRDAGAEWCRLLLDVAGARATAGDIEQARRRYDEAAQAARRAGSTELLAEAALGFATWQRYGEVDHAAIALLREALEGLPGEDDAVRAGLLGRLAVRLDPQREQPRREALLDEAVAMGHRLGDDALLSRLLALSTLVRWRPESAQRRRADAAQTIALAHAAGDREALLWAHTIRYTDAFALGDVAGADAELEDYARVAADLRQPYYRWCLTVLRAGRAIFAGELDEGERLAEEAVAENRARALDSEQEYAVQRLVLAAARGRPDPAVAPTVRGFAEQYPDLPMWRAILAFAELAAGDEAAARASFERLARDDFAATASDPDAICTLAFAAETCAALSDRRRAEVLHGLLEPYGERNVVVERGWAAWGAAAHALGLLAFTAGDAAAAAAHFARAAELNEAWGARVWARRSRLAAG